MELRVISGNFWWRYRNRLTLQRTLNIHSFALTPYAQGELYYDSRYNTWDKNTYEFGATLPLGKRVELQPYFEHDNSTHSSPQHVNALGFIVSLYF